MAERSGGDGKALEDLVATIEGLLIPQGFTVEKNRREYNENGVQIGELDITIRGKLGSGDIAWLIECRNRPSEGPAPGSWIEQLVGRRSRFKFDKVTAVSTTGFAAGAVEYAATVGIELRELSQITSNMTTWLGTQTLHSQERRHDLKIVHFHIAEHESEDREKAATEKVRTTSGDKPLLRSTQTGATISAADAFIIAIQQLPAFFADVLPGQPPKHVSFRGNYPNDQDHYVIDTMHGPVRVTSIEFEGDLSIIQTDVPLSDLAEYRAVGSAQPVSQSAGFQFVVKGETVTIDIHHLKESGKTVFAVRQMGTPTTEAPAPTPASKDDASGDK